MCIFWSIVSRFVLLLLDFISHDLLDYIYMFCARISKNKSNRVSSDNTQPKKVSFYAYYPPTSHRTTPIERITRQPKSSET